MDKFYTILIILLGEILAIGAEVYAAKYFVVDNAKFSSAFFRALPFIILGSVLLLAGYMWGLKSFKNIWIVSAISITSILITEPFMNYLITGQLPTLGAVVGLILGFLGFIAALFL